MDARRLQVLYRQFLFRIVDVEALSAHARGDATRLLGQLAALLIFVSLVLSVPAVFTGQKGQYEQNAVSFVATMVGQHFLIATTMLVVGLFAVLSWEATFPDSRDVLVLGPLPVRGRTILLAKLFAAVTGLGITVLLLHSFSGLIWPFLFSARTNPVTLPALAFDPTPVPIAVTELKPMLDRALAGALTNGSLQPGTGAGLAIGVYKLGETQTFTYGAAKPDSLFEVGSITKTFTGLLLASMVADGNARLDEPVRHLLPRGLVDARSGEEITLADLATHHSGLPMMPDNFRPANRADPYADYDVNRLYAYVRRRGLVKPEDTLYRYSNLGVGLLGQALAERAGKPYAALVQDKITGPLGLTDTVVALSPDQRTRFLQGYDDRHRPVHEWTLNGLAGAGGLRSSARDMLAYVVAYLHPENHPGLARALLATQRVQNQARAGAQIGLAWTWNPETRAYRHGGTTAGFTSHAFFIPQCDCAAVVLMNSGPNPVFNPDLIAEHIRQRFTGEPAVSLDTVAIPAHSGLSGVLRSYASYWLTVTAAALFVYCLISGVHGLLAGILPRRLFLRVSGYIQVLAFCLAVVFFFLQPGLGGLDDLTARATWRMVEWLPSYWFLALYQQLNGTLHPALLPLAQRASIGLVIVLTVSATGLALCYERTLRRIVEDPELALAPPFWRWLPRIGVNRFQSAVGQFAIRTFVRSKQHRLTLAFYLGVALAFTTLLLKDPSTKRALADSAAGNPWRDASVALWASSVILMTLAVVGMRVAFALPVDLRANWIFRITGARSVTDTVAAARRPLLVLTVVPVWLVSAVVCIGLWPSWQSVGHTITLGLIGLLIVELSLLSFHKIPFACSWLPGKSRIHVAFFGAFGLLLVSIRGVLTEREAFQEVTTAAAWFACLVLAWAGLRLAVSKLAGQHTEAKFEHDEAASVQGLGIGAG